MNKTPHTNIDQLKLLVAKLKENHDFLAWVFSTYQRKEHMDDEQLISLFKTTPEMFVRLALCKCPNPDSSAFASQIREISTFTNIDPSVLASIIRQVDTLELFSKIPNRESTQAIGRLATGLLAAARDNLEGEENEPKDSSKGSDSVKGGNDEDGKRKSRNS